MSESRLIEVVGAVADSIPGRALLGAALLLEGIAVPGCNPFDHSSDQRPKVGQVDPPTQPPYDVQADLVNRVENYRDFDLSESRREATRLLNSEQRSWMTEGGDIPSRVTGRLMNKIALLQSRNIPDLGISLNRLDDLVIGDQNYDLHNTRDLIIAHGLVDMSLYQSISGSIPRANIRRSTRKDLEALRQSVELSAASDTAPYVHFDDLSDLYNLTRTLGEFCQPYPRSWRIRSDGPYGYDQDSQVAYYTPADKTDEYIFHAFAQFYLATQLNILDDYRRLMGGRYQEEENLAKIDLGNIISGYLYDGEKFRSNIRYLEAIGLAAQASELETRYQFVKNQFGFETTYRGRKFDPESYWVGSIHELDDPNPSQTPENQVFMKPEPTKRYNFDDRRLRNGSAVRIIGDPRLVLYPEDNRGRWQYPVEAGPIVQERGLVPFGNGWVSLDFIGSEVVTVK